LPETSAVHYFGGMTKRTLLMIALLLSAFQTRAAAQNAPQLPTARDTAFIDSVVAAHRYRVALQNGKLVGDGVAFLLRALGDAQFVTVGESHNVLEIPLFTAALFDTLHAVHGFNYFAIENGPTVMEMASAAARRGNADSLYAFANRYPHAFQFWNDQEMQALAQIGRTAGKVRDPIWGLDNEWGTAHILERLVAIAPNASAKIAAASLLEEAQKIEGIRTNSGATNRFIYTDSMRFVALRNSFQPQRGTEAARLLDALQFGNRTYLRNIAGGKGEPTGYIGNLEREQYMKRNFLERYRAAQAAGERLPKVLLKFGNVHTGLGRNENYVHSLGNFLHEFAFANGLGSFNMIAWIMNPPGKYWTISDYPEYRPLISTASATETYLFDLRPLRAHSYSKAFNALHPKMRDLVFRQDAVLIIGGANPGTRELVRPQP
jgi:hypothetical protein